MKKINKFQLVPGSVTYIFLETLKNLLKKGNLFQIKALK